MENTETPKEPTNAQLLEFIRGFINVVLEDTAIIRNRTFDINDKTEPTYGNVRIAIDLINKLTEKVDKLSEKVAKLESKLE